MLAFSTIALSVALRLLLLVAPSSLVGAAPAPQSPAGTPSNYWLANIKKQGKVAYGDPNFQIFRNVQDFGARGDGVSDDTAAINNAISSGARCGQGCDSTTITPAIIYFPPGTYMVKAPIVQYYYTQFIGDAVSIPTIKAMPGFSGIAVLDSDPYANGGFNWYTNQNNFFRQIRNFVIDLTALPANTGTGIHWQVAQATSLQNIRFEMIRGGSGNAQQGIFMDNGSGGWMTDLTFNGGNYGAFLGNQQFTTRNLVFNDVNTAIYMNWDWVWTFKSLSINNCGVGINMASTGTVGSVIVQDSKFVNTPTAILTSHTLNGNNPATGGTLVIDNTDFSGSSKAVADPSGRVILNGGGRVASWGQGNAYTTGGSITKRALPQVSVQGSMRAPPKPGNLLNGQGNIVERSRPQYENVPASAFISVKDNGARGDGVTDDTAAIQAIFDRASSDQVVYFDHGAYLITNTVRVPKNIRITGEIWPLIMAQGSSFSDINNPKPVFQVGQPGDVGAVEMSDLIFETRGPAPGAILVEWNVGASSQASSGMWDVHMRIGGSAGTLLQSDTCSKNPSAIAPANTRCEGAFLLLHVTKTASIYLENNWFWVADHELDRGDHNQINIFNGRGVLIEAQQGPVWLYGTSSEHHQLYNYQISNAHNVYMGAIQTETPYFQSNPNALQPFAPNGNFNDPNFSSCTTDACRKAWGLRIVGSSNILVYGAGLYSFFDNYDQTCLDPESCQQNMVGVDGSSQVFIYALATKASTSMVTVDGNEAVPQGENRNNFCSTVTVFESP